MLYYIVQAFSSTSDLLYYLMKERMRNFVCYMFNSIEIIMIFSFNLDLFNLLMFAKCKPPMLSENSLHLNQK